MTMSICMFSILSPAWCAASNTTDVCCFVVIRNEHTDRLQHSSKQQCVPKRLLTINAEKACKHCVSFTSVLLQDYRVHIKHTDGRFEKIPYFSLPANDLNEVIAPSCYSCFDYVNGLADMVGQIHLEFTLKACKLQRAFCFLSEMLIGQTLLSPTLWFHKSARWLRARSRSAMNFLGSGSYDLMMWRNGAGCGVHGRAFLWRRNDQASSICDCTQW